jgi:hypothetical protein
MTLRNNSNNLFLKYSLQIGCGSLGEFAEQKVKFQTIAQFVVVEAAEIAFCSNSNPSSNYRGFYGSMFLPIQKEIGGALSR